MVWWFVRMQGLRCPEYVDSRRLLLHWVVLVVFARIESSWSNEWLMWTHSLNRGPLYIPRSRLLKLLPMQCTAHRRISCESGNGRAQNREVRSPDWLMPLPCQCSFVDDCTSEADGCGTRRPLSQYGRSESLLHVFLMQRKALCPTVEVDRACLKLFAA